MARVSKATELRSLEAEMKLMASRISNLRSDPELEKEVAFEKELRALMANYGKSLRDIIMIIDPAVTSSTAVKKAQRTRKVKQYTHPESGEVIETKGGNHKLLKQWKEKYGSDMVESWATIQA